jgi:methionine synthase I (cobalamin-dependent)
MSTMQISSALKAEVGSRRLRIASLLAVAATHPEAAPRILTFQANTGDKEVEELDGCGELVTELPALFVEGLGRLRHRFGLRVLGGCCGTDGGYIAALAQRLA